MASGTNKHSAAGSATGYLYQCRYALLAALREIPKRPHLSVSIERFDDVAFDNLGAPEERIQTKHHSPNVGNLTDRSTDLWKTLGIWSDSVHADPQSTSRTQFNLLTTGTAPAGSAASFLRHSARDEPKAAEALLEAAIDSTNEDTKSARQSFVNLSEGARIALLKAVVVLDVGPSATDVINEIRDELFYAAPKAHLDHFVQRLEGWWFDKVIAGLQKGNCSIPLTELEDRIEEIREGFSRNSLPVDYEDMFVPDEILDQFDSRAFVRQLRIIKVGNARISYAIRDFYRAFEQRSRWAREELLFDPEIIGYELALQEAWQPRFAEAQDLLDESAPENLKIELGQGIYRWAEQEAEVPLRNLRKRFLCHGSYHMLADNLKLGWHPDYESILSNEAWILEPELISGAA